MKRQLYQMGGLSSLYNIGSEGQKPIYPRISDIESSLSNAEQRIGDPSSGSFGGTSNGGFASPIAGVYSQFNEGRQLGGIGGGEMNSFNSTPFPGRQLGGTQSPALSFEGVGDPRLGAAIIPGNQLQMMMRGGAADGGLMREQQGAAQDQLTEEQAFALMPEGVKEAFASMIEAGVSPEEARRLISQQLSEMSIQQMEMQRESQDVPEYYDRRLQILEPEQMREEMQNPSMPIRPDMAGGGITPLSMDEMMVPRGEYGLGSLVKSVGKVVKSATKAVTNIAKSDIGKAALLGAAAFGIPGTSFGGLLGRASFGGAAPGIFGFGGIGNALGAAKTGLLGTVQAGTGDYGGGLFSGLANKFSGAGGLSSLIPGKGTLLAAGAGLLGGAAVGGALTPQQIEAGMKRNPAAVRGYLAEYYKNINPEATESEAEQYALEQTREYAAEGGIMGRQNYGLGSLVSNLLKDPAIAKQIEMASPMKQYLKQYYSNVNPGKSVEEIEAFVRENAAYGGPMGEPRQNPQGVMELDYRQEGGFVPVGIKEKADDVPAMLSKNEFVFTADAVRNAGDGDVEKGAQRLYNTMKTLENGGIV